MLTQQTEWDWSNWEVYNPDIKSLGNLILNLKLRLIKPVIPDNGTILEVGAGSGYLLTRIGIELGEKNNMLVGSDSSDSSIKLMKKSFNYWNCGVVIKGDAFHLPFHNDSVDMVLSGGLLEHFPPQQVKKIILEMTRVLKPMGVFYADIAPSKFSLASPLHGVGSRKGVPGSPNFESTLTKKEWRGIFKRSGLSSVKVFSDLIIPPSFVEKSRFLIEILYKFENVLHVLRGTWFSDVFGISYTVVGRK